ncbi:hypothetical protein NMY22_g19006 [Coprinellus aureogranulatus]|nr:hypothetical protein NMY22_g19006 [Coprinellus aureogranulatus]
MAHRDFNKPDGSRPPQATKPLLNTLPYFYLSKVYNAAADRGDLLPQFISSSGWPLWDPPPGVSGEVNALSWSLCAMEIWKAWRAHSGKGTVVNLCTNNKHSERPKLFENQSVKICSGCRWMTYCSKECQREDWISFHSQECRFIAKRVRGLRTATSSRDFIDIRRSQLVYIESEVNDLEYGLEELLRRAGPPPTRPSGACANPNTELCDHGRPGNRDWHWWDCAPFVEDSKADPDRITVMEGHFQLTQRMSARTLVKLKYDPTKEGDPELRKTRYRVVGSVMRVVHVQQLIQKAEVAPSLENYQDVVDYLSGGRHFDPVEKILEHLDGSLIPPLPLDPTDRDAIRNIELASKSVYTCIPLFRSLRFAPRMTEEIKAYKERCFEMMVGKWGAVKAWMAHLVVHAPGSNDSGKVLQYCADALVAILAGAQDSPAKQEMVSMPGTADLVYVLLCQTSRRTGKYQILRVYDHPRAHCAATELFKHIFDSTAGWDAMEQRLRAVTGRTRKNILNAIGGRAEQMAEEATPENIHGYAISFTFLTEGLSRLSSDADLWDALYRGKAISRCASALCKLAEKAHNANVADQDAWNYISDSIQMLTSFTVKFAPNPIHTLPSVIEAGIFRAALICLSHVDRRGSSLTLPSSGAVAALESMLPYFYVGKVYLSAADRGDLDDFDPSKNPWDHPMDVRGAKAIRIWCLCAVELQRAWKAHSWRKGFAVNLCSNAKHGERHTPSDDCTVRTCSSCQWVTYCSTECQKEDWIDFHSRECRFTAKRAQGFHMTSSKNIVDIRRSQLRYIESHVNEYGVEQIFRRAMPPPIRPPGAPTPILIQNFSIMNLQESRDGPGSVPQYTDEWDDGAEMAARISQFVEDSKADPQRITIMEGNFQLTDRTAVRTLAKIEYDPYQKKGNPSLGKNTLVSP